MKVQMRIAVAFLASVSLMLAGKVRADVAHQTIKVNFSQSVQIPGRVLPAGTYWFVLADTMDRKTVQILSEDRRTSFGFLQTVNRQRSEVTDGVTFTVADRTAQPAAVIAWFYPGETVGHEFVYPRAEEQELALAKQDTQISGD